LSAANRAQRPARARTLEGPTRDRGELQRQSQRLHKVRSATDGIAVHVRLFCQGLPVDVHALAEALRRQDGRRGVGIPKKVDKMLVGRTRTRQSDGANRLRSFPQ
jgi:hypothetical protein